MTRVEHSPSGRGIGRRVVVHLLRHGEVDNPSSLLYGRLPDYHLSGLGRQMADVVADYLADRDVGLVTASSLERAQETAHPLAARLGVPVRTDDRLIEAGNHFEGRRFGHDDGSLAHPGNWLLLRNPFVPSWGEPYRRIADRMIAAIDAARAAVVELPGGDEVVLVSHQLPIETVRRRLEGRRLWHDPRQRRCTLASLTSLTYIDGDLAAIAYTEPAAALLPGANPVPGA